MRMGANGKIRTDEELLRDYELYEDFIFEVIQNSSYHCLLAMNIIRYYAIEVVWEYGYELCVGSCSAGGKKWMEP